MVKWCCLPLVSVKRKSTKRASFSSIRLMTLFMALMDMALLLAGQLEMMQLIVPFLLGGDNIYLQKAGVCLQMGAGRGFRLPFGVGKMRQPENQSI